MARLPAPGDTSAEGGSRAGGGGVGHSGSPASQVRLPPISRGRSSADQPVERGSGLAVEQIAQGRRDLLGAQGARKRSYHLWEKFHDEPTGEGPRVVHPQELIALKFNLIRNEPADG